MIRTFSAYGYRLGGPRSWNLHQISAGDQLRTAWYDETDPTHYDFAASAMAATRARLGLRPDGDDDMDVPFEFLAAVEASPPDWDLIPTQHRLPARRPPPNCHRSTGSRSPSKSSSSAIHCSTSTRRTTPHCGDVADHNPAFGVAGDRWHSTLIEALTTLGLEPVGMPAKLWFRSN